MREGGKDHQEEGVLLLLYMIAFIPEPPTPNDECRLIIEARG
jgi:hypothetical protein